MKIILNRLLIKSLFFLNMTLLAILLIINTNSLPLKLSIIIIACLIYLIWAYLYHHLDKTLNSVVILEYVLLAMLVIILLTGFIT